MHGKIKDIILKTNFKNRKIGFIEAFSIGVGGMVGGGIFAVLGLTISLSHGAAPISFAIAGLIALVTVYSYVKLSLTYPSEGGTIEFIVQGIGNGVFSAIANNLLLISYVIMLALYAYAFGSYGSALFTGSNIVWLQKILSVGVIVLFASLNLMGSFMIGKAEDIMVFIKLTILIIFAGVGFLTIHVSRLDPASWTNTTSIITGGLMIFLAYEGFELIANTAKDIVNPKKNIPRAFYSAVIFVILLYICVAIVAVGNVSIHEAMVAKDYVLAVAAKPFFGKTGFAVIAVAAMLSTASAINATLYGGSRVGYLVAKLGELPKMFDEKIKQGYEGVIIIALLSIIFATTFNLENISIAGSAGFLIIFALVNLSNFKLYKETKSNRIIPGIGFLLCTISTVVLIGYNIIHNPSNLISSALVMGIIAIFSFIYYKVRQTNISEYIDKDLEKIFKQHPKNIE
ncbi:MAG TPA: amino acid permease [Candidatus Kaiserbacteria bacterium]|nr:amino acid permease [Candidatus Kaiserbacteria bacterium]